MSLCYFATDLHGSAERYDALVEAVRRGRPRIVLLGGDLTPHPLAPVARGDFIGQALGPRLEALREDLGPDYPEILVILGNDDSLADEISVVALEKRGLWRYIHARRVDVDGVPVYGYAMVPPTPFLNKDWERYDVSRYVPPGGVSPEEGYRFSDVDPAEIRRSTIAGDLKRLTGEDDLATAVMLFHSPPHETTLDRAATDGMMVDHVPLDLHVGSIAIRRLIERRQPSVTLHGHIHESASITGSWRDRIGRTHLFGAAHDGPELALVRFDTEEPGNAERELI